MADQPKTVRAIPTRDFSDAGSERNFTAGKAVEITEGEFANYLAAGLVEDPAEMAAPDAPAA